MSKKKTLLIAGLGLYVGILNLPKQGKEAWMYYEKVDDHAQRVACTILYTAMFPVIYPLDRAFQAVAPKMYDKATMQVNIHNEALKFRHKMDDYEAEQKHTTKESK